MKREVDITYPDGSVHHVIVYQANVTNDGRIVISYYDVSNDMQDSFTEIIAVNGEFQKNPYHNNWEYYERCFRPFDRELSDQIILALKEKVKTYKPIPELNETKAEENETKTLEEPVDPPNRQEIHYINSVIFANAGGSMVNMYPTTYENGLLKKQKYNLYNGTTFFGNPYTYTIANSRMERYAKLDINENDKKVIIDTLINYFGENFDISSIPDMLKIKINSRKSFMIDFSSCDNWQHFNRVKDSDSISIDLTNVEKTTYPDYLSSALHFELPHEINIAGIGKRYGYDANMSNKQIR